MQPGFCPPSLIEGVDVAFRLAFLYLMLPELICLGN